MDPALVLSAVAIAINIALFVVVVIMLCKYSRLRHNPALPPPTLMAKSAVREEEELYEEMVPVEGDTTGNYPNSQEYGVQGVGYEHVFEIQKNTSYAAS